MTKIIMKIPKEKYRDIKKKIADLFLDGKKVSIATMLTEVVIKSKVPKIIDLHNSEDTEINKVMIDIPDKVYEKIRQCAVDSSVEHLHLVSIHNIVLHIIQENL